MLYYLTDIKIWRIPVKKRIVLAVVAVLLVVALFFAYTLWDRSSIIKKVFVSNGFTVTSETLENEMVRICLERDLTEDQLSQVEDYDIVYCHFLANGQRTSNAVIVVCPTIGEAKEFLGNDLYQEMKNNGQIKGNCILFSGYEGVKDMFDNYLLFYLFPV